MTIFGVSDSIPTGAWLVSTPNNSWLRSMRQTYVNSSLAQVFRSQQRRPRPKTPASEEGGPRPETSERHTGAGSEEDRFVFDQHRVSCLYGAWRTIKQSAQAFPMQRFASAPKSRGVGNETTSVATFV